MKRIAFVTPDLKSGGSERVAARLTHLFGGRYEVCYIVFDDSDVSYDINAELINLNAPPSNNKMIKVINTFKRAAGIRRTVKERNIDAVMSFTSIANRAMRFSRAGCPTVGACRGYGDLEAHTEDYHKVIKSGAVILFNSIEMQEFYLEKYPYDRDGCVTIENLIDFDRIRERSREELPVAHKEFFDAHKVVSTVGILSRHKGHWDLLKSFELLRERVPDAGLVIVGHRGLLENEIREMAKNHKYADDILFVGYQSNPFKYIAHSSAFALSSISEGFPNVLIEAMACAVPCVSTACKTGPREIMFNEFSRVCPKDEYVVCDNGILTPVFDGRADFDYRNKNAAHYIFAEALERVLSDFELSQRLTEAGLNRAARNAEEVIAHKYFELIERVTG
ncbi:MAG: glycosyltransferase [Clostridia bacterium]|nr:glycosyltransferase [Clostridia bacterium]